MLYDAIVVAGGRSRRLGEVPKAGLVLPDGRTLLEHTVAAVPDARRIVVVGPRPAVVPSDPRIVITREDPPFSGPAAALGAGLDALGDAASSTAPAAPATSADPAMPGAPAPAAAASETTDPPAWVLVLACDMPHVAALVAAVTSAVTGAPADAGDDARDGAIAEDETGRRQPLAAIYRASALRAAVERRRAEAALEGSSMFALIRGLQLAGVAVPPGTGADVDTWDDADRLGVRRPGATGPGGQKEGNAR